MTSTTLQTFVIQHVKIISTEGQVFKNQYVKITSITVQRWISRQTRSR
jgi:hypothetical protein